MKMMNNVKKKTDNKLKETFKHSLSFKLVGLVATIITVSFIIFSIAIYSLVRQQLIEQEENVTQSVSVTFANRLIDIPHTLQISNVVPSLSPNTRRILEGKAPIAANEKNNIFSDDILATLASRDTTVLIYNPAGEIVFSNGTLPKDADMPNYDSRHVLSLQNIDGKLHLQDYNKIYSSKTGKLTGYLVVDNQLTKTNAILRRLRNWMFFLSVVAILIFIILSYLMINSIVKPIKRMSKISRAVNDDPNSQERMPKLKREDELGELANNFNQMLDRMQAYIQQQKQFVGDVSHELRTPVAVIQGHLNLLERWGKDDPEVLEESIKASLQETNRMKHLIQEMLDLTRAEQIDIQYPDEVSDVNEVLTRTVNDMRMIHQDFKITYNDALTPNTMIKMYHNHLEQILIILMDNAIKYSTDRKEIIVDASTEEDKVEITVQDFGEGIAPQEQAKIFNRFYRVDKARTREKGGNGLGLSIAQKLVESYNGEISVTSQLGSGSKFKVEFPLLSQGKKG
ncbi:HAMP domain-containing histidine kinase [uncultured Lactobacillus sp.]|uniref:HAMP domain-containing sensor histidine kinase n=1 Tax=uncultured Lactobacillus sp. TaxID=153152 RepID=UPI002622F741|nr:HAMP domain-containing histidine kinase [uncultured Lactobacillus sp.]